MSVEHQAVRVVTHAIKRRAGQQLVGRERLVPLREVQVAGHDGGGALVALGHQFVQILVGGRVQRFEVEVVHDEQRHAREIGELAFIAAGCARLKQRTVTASRSLTVVFEKSQQQAL